MDLIEVLLFIDFCCCRMMTMTLIRDGVCSSSYYIGMRKLDRDVFSWIDVDIRYGVPFVYFYFIVYFICNLFKCGG